MTSVPMDLTQKLETLLKLSGVRQLLQEWPWFARQRALAWLSLGIIQQPMSWESLKKMSSSAQIYHATLYQFYHSFLKTVISICLHYNYPVAIGNSEKCSILVVIVYSRPNVVDTLVLYLYQGFRDPNCTGKWPCC